MLLVPYAFMAGLLVLALVVLTASLLVTMRSFRRLHAARSAVTSDLADRAGLLRARVAGVGVALRRRCPDRSC
ncbi:bacteriophage holin [Actinopolyspora halophila]|uniref:bacteriophage holin n=1 Tax=Actinopolyspora halophila TaxID=1850 RepID=UPI00039E52CB|nr:bacteriophage holin [Actinopolyspora halophila]